VGKRLAYPASLPGTLLLASVGLTGCFGEQGVQEERRPDGVHSPEAEALQSRVDQVREEFDLPGLVVALAEGVDPPIVAASGYADLDRGIPVDPDTPFFIGSISKNLFTTAALLLAEEGILSLEDPISDYLDWPRGDEITVRMLLNHTTGIPDYFGSLGLPGGGSGVPDFFSRPRLPSEIFEMMPSREPTFDPGSDQAYSNTNGLLLGAVIESATGQPLGDVFQERIVSPLGLKDTYLYDERTADRPRARGYCGQPGWALESGELGDCSFGDDALPNSADGSIVASALDLLRYHLALRNGEILSASSWDAMRRVEPGRVNGLNYLIMSGPLGESEGNAGRAIGHVSASVYYLERDLYVVMLLNRGDAALPMRRFMELRYGTEAGGNGAG
jgi:D-alanyl-D-alanine carboxypeptidase